MADQKFTWEHVFTSYLSRAAAIMLGAKTRTMTSAPWYAIWYAVGPTTNTCTPVTTNIHAVDRYIDRTIP